MFGHKFLKIKSFSIISSVQFQSTK